MVERYAQLYMAMVEVPSITTLNEVRKEAA
jgi:hypothetical protein